MACTMSISIILTRAFVQLRILSPNHLNVFSGNTGHISLQLLRVSDLALDFPAASTACVPVKYNSLTRGTCFLCARLYKSSTIFMGIY